MSFIELLKYIFLGIVQGVTEVLPVSSSGHVAIFQQILNIKADEGLLFLILVNVGSLLAIIYYFRKFIYRLFSNFFYYLFVPSSRVDTEEGFHYVLKIAAATIPGSLIGYFLATTVDAIYQDHYLIMAGAGLIMTATVLYIVRNASYVNGRQTISYKDAIFIGIFQAFAILPGLSRSGITTSAGLRRKMSMETSLNFSFMLYIPLSIGSFMNYLIIVLDSPDLTTLGIDPTKPYQIFYYIAALIASFFTTRFALKFMFKLYREGRLLPFAIYTFALGVIAFMVGLVTSH